MADLPAHLLLTHTGSEVCIAVFATQIFLRESKRGEFHVCNAKIAFANGHAMPRHGVGTRDRNDQGERRTATPA
jgi:hypothetical protein